MRSIAELEEELDITFKQPEILKQAFTHSSYVNEHRKKAISDNERLEFLGDAVLELGVSQYLFRKYADMPEGEMTKLRAAIVCEPSLQNFAKDLGLNRFILLGKGEERTGGRERPALLADVFEAFLGALYLDQGYDRTMKFLRENVFPKIKTGAFSYAMDYKSQLQEYIQRDKNQQVEYEVVNEEGPSHEKQFTVRALVNDKISGTGFGKTKKEAEQRAAKDTLDNIQE